MGERTALQEQVKPQEESARVRRFGLAEMFDLT